MDRIDFSLHYNADHKPVHAAGVTPRNIETLKKLFPKLVYLDLDMVVYLDADGNSYLDSASHFLETFTRKEGNPLWIQY